LLVKQLTTIDDDEIQSRFKRSVLNFIGGFSKMFFGTMVSKDASRKGTG
jgi:hypothetical protein